MKKFLSKRNILVLIVVIVATITSITFVIKRNLLVEKKTIREDIGQNNSTIDIAEAPFDKLAEDDFGTYYNSNKNRVVFNKNQISNLTLSPLKNKIGFLDSTGVKDKSILYDRQVILYAGNVNSRDFKEIFHGSFRTSGWEWFNNDEIIVYYNCGTECQLLYLANVDSGEGNALIYGVNYDWSPNSELALAYHYYSWGIYGITVGNRKGKDLFSVTRNPTKNDNQELMGKTIAMWSPDSSKLALVIKKENKNQMELLIFDVVNNFKQIFGQDVNNSGEYNLGWDEDNKSVVLNQREIVL